MSNEQKKELQEEDQEEQQAETAYQPDTFNSILEIYGWIRIFLSPALLGAIIGGVLYLANDANIGLAVIVLFCGMIAGIFWANKVYKSEDGTMHFVSRTDASPDLNNLEHHDEEKK